MVHIDYQPCSFGKFLAEARYIGNEILYCSFAQDGICQSFAANLDESLTSDPTICLSTNFAMIKLDTSRGELFSATFEADGQTVRAFKFNSQNGLFRVSFTTQMNLM